MLFFCLLLCELRLHSDSLLEPHCMRCTCLLKGNRRRVWESSLFLSGSAHSASILHFPQLEARVVAGNVVGFYLKSLLYLPAEKTEYVSKTRCFRDSKLREKRQNRENSKYFLFLRLSSRSLGQIRLSYYRMERKIQRRKKLRSALCSLIDEERKNLLAVAAKGWLFPLRVFTVLRIPFYPKFISREWLMDVFSGSANQLFNITNVTII